MKTRNLLIIDFFLFFVLALIPSMLYGQITETTDTLNVLPGETVNMSESAFLGTFFSPPNITYQTSGNNRLNYATYVNKGVTISYDEYLGFYNANIKFDLKINSTLTPGIYNGGYVAYEFYNGSFKIKTYKFNYIFNVIDITVTAPNGGEVWNVGTTENITWAFSGTSGNVKIEYSTNGGSSWTTIVSSTTDDGSYAWSIPNTPSTNCLVKITDTDGNPSDQSNNVFTIKLAPVHITVTAPNGAEIWQVGTTQNIIWTSSGTSGNVKIEYSINGGSSWTTIVSSTTDDGVHPWTIPNTPSTNCLVKITDTDGSPSDQSNGAFTIQSSHFVFKTTVDSYSMIIDAATINGTSLPPGDEIGVFTPAGLCVGASAWSGTTPLPLTAWKDDTQTPAIDGYKDGEQMYFRIWDLSAMAEYPAKPTYSQGNGTFGNGPYARIIKLEATSSVTQTIPLPKGWSWISLNVKPDTLDVASVMRRVKTLVIMVDGAGQFYIPGVINGIGNISMQQGYKVFVNANDTLVVRGQQMLASTPIPVGTRWNFVSYLPKVAMNAEAVLASIKSNLAIAKNDGGGFYIPGVVNTLGNMYPGKGYKLYLDAMDTLVYPGGTNLTKALEIIASAPLAKPTHFKIASKTGENYCVVITDLNIEDQAISSGDEIGIFTESGICVGGGVWNGRTPLAIATWQDDDQTLMIDGYNIGEKMIFKYWNPVQKTETELVATFHYGDGTFGKGGYAMVQLESTLLPDNYPVSQNYPNPFNSEMTIKYQLPQPGKVTLIIYNLIGQEIKRLVDEEKSIGHHTVVWDGKDAAGQPVPSGVYICHIKTRTFNDFKKVTYMK